jgi:hypothetical protein
VTLASFFAFAPDFTGGVNVAVGDVNGDCTADIITGGGPHVKVFDGKTLVTLASFLAFAPTFTGGVQVSAEDVNEDGRLDIVTRAQLESATHIRAFDGLSLALLLNVLS